MSNDDYVTQTIYNQLGGRRFKVMTGCYNFVTESDKLRFSLPTDIEVKDNINLVTIILDPSDTYTMLFERKTFQKLSDSIYQTKTVHRFTDVYCDMLQDMFTEYTGLYTHL